MKKLELKRLIKIENRIAQICSEDLGLKFYPIEFDIVPPQKMLEIMAYNIPTNISNWKYGRDYEKQRTIYEHGASGLPYEVVINSDPAKAYLMNDNKFAVHCLVIAHVYGHCSFFTMNKYFINSRQDIIGILYEASKRFLEYERKFGIDEVEKVEDAGHALQLHSSPFETSETENEKKQRIFTQRKQSINNMGSIYGDLTNVQEDKIKEDIELYNQKLWREIKLKTPVEPTEDILRYIINNSQVLEDWQRDILEVCRMTGQYFWPIMKTRFMNEGFATVIHEKVMMQLFKEGLLTSEEHADFNYSNSLVKASSRFTLNPYLVGSSILRNIEERWDKGLYGDDWESCNSRKEKEEWNTNKMNGWKQCLDVVERYTDWFFMQEFLTPELIRDIKIYLYTEEEKDKSVDYVITKNTAEEIRKKIVNYFSQQVVPLIEVIDGNFHNSGYLNLKHKWNGIDLDETYCKETLKHIAHIWGKKVYIHTKQGEGKDVAFEIRPS